MDWFQISAIMLGLVQMFFIVLYFTAFVHPPDVVFVSDLLFDNLVYRVCMTVFVCIQLSFSFGYAFAHRENHWRKFALMVAGLLSALIGWFLLTYSYIDEATDSVSMSHMAGVGLFVCGSTVYFAVMAVDVWVNLKARNERWRVCVAVLIWLLGFSTLAMGIVFIYHFIKKRVVIHVEDSSNSWVFEHVGYLSFVAAHVLFFIDESPDPFKPKNRNSDENTTTKVKSVFNNVIIGPEDYIFFR
jgi:hypothetical protein